MSSKPFTWRIIYQSLYRILSCDIALHHIIAYIIYHVSYITHVHHPSHVVDHVSYAIPYTTPYQKTLYTHRPLPSYDMWYKIWSDIIYYMLYDIGYGAPQCDSTSYDMVWCDACIIYDMVRCHAIWYDECDDMIWYTIANSTISSHIHIIAYNISSTS